MEQEKEPKRPDRARRVLGPVIVIVACVGIVLAAFVVVRNASRIRLGKPPVRLTTMTLEQEFTTFVHTSKRRLVRVERRFEKYRSSAAKLTPQQDSLARLYDSGLARLRAAVAVLDTVEPARALRELRPEILRDYRGLMELLAEFVKTFTGAGGAELDSLDRELLELISE